MSVTGDEEDVCRVCRSGIETGPLHRPCKCAGSIKHVHEDCLLEWLGHSKKQYCELCHYPFAFTKIYRSNVPETLPPLLVVRRAFSSVFWSALFVLRAILVTFTWVGVLPYATVWVWRFYWFSGNNMSSAISDLLSSRWTGSYAFPTVFTTANTTVDVTLPTASPTSSLFSSSLVSPANLTELELYKESLRTIAKDTLTGQLITCCVLVVFVCAFVLREWAHQLEDHPPPDNARQGQPQLADPERHPVPPPPPPQASESPAETNRATDATGTNVVEQEENNASEGLIALSARNNISGRANDSLARLRLAEILESESNRLSAVPEASTSSSAAGPSTSDVAEHDVNSQPLDNGKGKAPEAEVSPDDIASAGASEGFRPADEERRSEKNQEHSFDPYHNSDFEPNLQGWKRGEVPPEAFVPLPQPPLRDLDEDNVDDGSDDDEDEEEEEEEEDAEANGDRAEGEGEAGIAGDDERMDDLDSIMEAIGMKGSLLTLLQSVALVVLMVSLILGVSVWLPYVIGRTVTSPGLMSLVLAPFIVALRLVYKIAPFLEVNISNAAHFIPLPQQYQVFSLVSQYVLTRSSKLLSKVSLDSAGPAFLEFTRGLSQFDNSLNRATCIFFGYVTVAVAAASYASAWGNRYSERVGQAVRDSVYQQLMLFKVAVFLLVELAVFPLACGILLDFCTLPLFPQASVSSRVDYHIKSPFSAAFLAWLIGTAFMFAFASLVSMARGGLRRGVLWFIKDPQDPQYQPIADLHKTAASAQVQKLLRSAVLYFIIVSLCFGVPSFVGRSLLPSIIPLRWNQEEPFSPFPIDLLVYFFLVPPTIRFARPKRILRKGFVRWARLTARQLRLTSFLFGQRRLGEEGRVVRQSWQLSHKLNRVIAMIMKNLGRGRGEYAVSLSDKDATWERDGYFIRVPAIDSVKVVSGRAMFVQVDERGYPLNPEGAELIKKQQEDSVSGNDDFTTVYLPPHYRLRLFAFLYLCWVSGTLATSALFLTPLQVGRWAFEYFLESPTHDIYSVCLGVYICLGFAFTIEKIYRHRSWFNPESWNTEGRQQLLQTLKEKSISALVYLRFAIVVGVILPLSVSAALDAFVLFPMRRKSSEVLQIWVAQEWAYGLIWLSICNRVARMAPRTFWLHERLEDISRARQRDTLEGVKEATSLAEYTLIRMLGVTLAPAAIAWTINRAISSVFVQRAFANGGIPNVQSSIRTIARCIYAMCTVAIVYSLIGKWIVDRVKRWLVKIRDDEFLVERRLVNVDESPATIIN